MAQTTIRRALLSVSNKEGLLEFARALRERDVVLLSTGGTAAMLRENGIEVTDVSSLTGFPEIMDGRVKTLHPKIHGGLLGVRAQRHAAAILQHQRLRLAAASGLLARGHGPPSSSNDGRTVVQAAAAGEASSASK